MMLRLKPGDRAQRRPERIGACGIGRPAQQHRVGPQRAQPVALDQRFDSVGQVGCDDDGRERPRSCCSRMKLCRIRSWADAPFQAIFDFALDHLAERQDAMARGQPVSVNGQVWPVPAGAAERQDDRPPVLRMIQLLLQLQQVLPRPLEQQAAVQIAPTRFDFLATDVPVQTMPSPRWRSTAHTPVDQEHHRQTADRAQQATSTSGSSEIAAGSWDSS